jgi:hypothetical protein
MPHKLLFILFLFSIIVLEDGLSTPQSDSLSVKSEQEWLQEVRHGLNLHTGFVSKDASSAHDHLIKCLTPHWVHASNSTGQQSNDIAELFKAFENAEIQNEEDYISPSGKFRLNFTRTGGHAVPQDDTNNSGIPDYIELAAAYADSSYRYMVTTLGYADPVLPSTPYLIRFRQINVYGFTQSSGSTSFIVVHRNFEGFPPNDDEDGDILGALKVTIAHEFKHAIQYATTRWQGESGQVRWIEMDATMMEEVVFHNVNDYINYLDVCQTNACSIFRDPNRSTPGSYYHATWKIYYSEAIGPEFWVAVWNELQLSPSTTGMIEAMKIVMGQWGLNFANEFTRNHLWHFNSGPDANEGYGFPDSQKFPMAQKIDESIELGTSRFLPNKSRERSAQYLSLEKSALPGGIVDVYAKFNINTAGLAMLLYYSDGSVTEYVVSASAIDSSGFLRLLPGVTLQNVERVGIVFTNVDNVAQDISYMVSVRDVSDNILLLSNYPNPFISQTKIPFVLTESSNIVLDVFDIHGRFIDRLIKNEMGAGFHEVVFENKGLASGVYFYRITTETGNHTGKMLLIN